MRRGDLVTLALQGEHGKPRPVLVIQSDLSAQLASTVTVALSISTALDAPLIRVPVEPSERNGLRKRSYAKELGPGGRQVDARRDPARPGPARVPPGNTLGARYRHWRRARIGRRLFFRYDAKAKVIVYAWINDQPTLRSSQSRTDPYSICATMLARGNPPDDWAALLTTSRQEWQAGK